MLDGISGIPKKYLLSNDDNASSAKSVNDDDRDLVQNKLLSVRLHNDDNKNKLQELSIKPTVMTVTLKKNQRRSRTTRRGTEIKSPLKNKKDS